MTFAQGVLRLVRSVGTAAEATAEAAAPLSLEPAPLSLAAGAEPLEFPAEVAGHGLADIQAAVKLVQAGLATRVVLAGFEPWPGLLWQAYQLTDGSDVLIIPTVARTGGRIDVVVTREPLG